MKTILAFVWSLPLIGFATSPSDDLRKALSETSLTPRPSTPTFGEPIFDSNYLSDIKKLPSNQKEKLASQLTQIIPRLAQEPPAPTVSKEVSPVKSGTSPRLGILVLTEIGTDEQKAQAFRNLDIFGTSRSEACKALASCEGTEGVKILKEYAENQFDNLTKNAPSPPEGQPAEKPDVKIYHAVIALAGAYHPDGPIAADKLRDRFIEITKIRLSADRLAAVEKGFETDMKKARHERESLLREKRPNNKRNSKAGNMNTEASGKIADSSFSVINSKWFWPSTAALLLVLAYWFIGKRKS